jgi:putative ABC transport system substrate-binding protein
VQIRRREFISLLGVATAWPFAVRAQQNGVMQRVGVLTTLSEDDVEGRAWLDAFRHRLAELGWAEGRNIQLEVLRTIGSPERAQTFAAEFANTKPGVVLTIGGTASAALVKQTNTVPAVFVTDTDPVAAGWVTSLARPGGNATGFVSFEITQGPKWLEMLKEIAPAMSRVFIFSSDNPQARVVLPTVEGALPKLGIAGSNAYVHDANEIERHFEAAARQPNAGVLVLASTISFLHRGLIVARAAEKRLPAVYTNSVFVRDGGLMSYGIDRTDQYRQAAGYVDRILRGEKPANLPVQTPTKFELVVNLKTAKALGLTIPTKLLTLADDVIE